MRLGQIFKHKIFWISTNISVVFFILGLILGKVYFSETRTQLTPVKALRQQGDFKYINPLLMIDIADKKDFQELTKLNQQIQNLINNEKKQGLVSDAGVYFRDYTNGHWTGVNEDHLFYPASLMKVPLMIAYFKEAENDPNILNKKIYYDGKLDLNQNEITKPKNPIKPQKNYEIIELIKKMIVESDNNATNLLSNNINQRAFNEIYSDLSETIPNPQNGNADYLSPKQYSVYLRVLRNSTYLSREHSELALDLLSQVEFKNGLLGGLPENTTVAHKFGEFLANDETTGTPVNQLHDCGIIYASEHNYMLCIMTKGKNRSGLEQTIKDISSLVYKEVLNQYK